MNASSYFSVLRPRHFFFTLGVAAAVVVTPATAQDKTGIDQAKSSPAALSLYSDAANLQNNEEYDLAVEEWSKFLRRHQEDPLAPRARHYLGVCLLQLKQYEQAAAAFQQAIAGGQKFAFLEEAYLNLGWAQYSHALAGQQDWFAKAGATFAALVEKFPQGKSNDQALFYRGEALYLQAKRETAIKSYARLVKEYPKSKLRADALYALGVTQQELDQHSQAGQTFDEFMRDFPDHQLVVEVRMRKADTLVQAGNPAAAEKMFAQVAQTKGFPSADYATVRQAYCAAQQGNFDRAAQLYARIPKDFPNSGHVPEATMAAGRAYYRAEQWDEATAWFRQVVKLGGPDFIEAAHWLCRILLRNNQPARAAELADRVLPKASGGDYLVHLKLDGADALFELPQRRAESLQRFLDIAKQHRDHSLAPQALYNAAYATMDLKQYDRGISLSKRFLDVYPADRLVPDVLYVQAECHLLQENHVEAEKLYSRLLAKYGQHSDVDNWHLRRATASYLQKRYARTIELLSPVVASLNSPAAVAEGQFLLGSCYRHFERFDSAVAALKASWTADPTWRQADETLLNLGRALQKLDRLDEAKATLGRLLANFPQSELLPRAHYHLAECSLAAEEFQAAAAQYAAVIENWPASTLVPHALLGLGWSHLRGGDYATALKSFSKLLADHANHALRPSAHHARAICRQQTGDHQGGVDDINAFLNSNPTREERSNALYVRGLCEIGLEQTAQASRTFQSLLDQDAAYQRSDKVLYELGWAFKNLQQQDEALESFHQLATRFPKSSLAAEAHFHLAENFYDRRQFPPALEGYTEAYSVSSDGELQEKTLHKMGWANYQLKQYQPALEAFSRHASKYPSGPLSSDGLFMQAECLFRLEDYEQALAAFKRAGAAGATNETIAVLTLLHGGQSAAQLNQWDESLKWLGPIAKKFPQSPYLPEALYEQGWALQNLQKWDDARHHYELVIEKSRSEIGARARFMLGELLFGRKDFAGAIAEFRRLLYGYGGENSAAEIKPWQAKGGLEAGRCAAVLAGQTSNREQKAAYVANARKYLRYVTEKYAGTEEATVAAEQLKKYGT